MVRAGPATLCGGGANFASHGARPWGGETAKFINLDASERVASNSHDTEGAVSGRAVGLFLSCFVP